MTQPPCRQAKPAMRTIRINGATAEYRQAGNGPDLLLLHSLLTDISVFERILPSLVRTHRVTCLNLPGFGASDPVALTTVGEHADYVARVMDALSLSPTVDVFGNGFGAFVALELAIRHGTRMSRLMVADTAAAFPEPAKAPFRGMAERVRANGISAILDTAIGRMFPPAFQAAHPEVVAARKAALAPVDPSCFARACVALAALDLRPRLANIRNPTLVMCGVLDQTTPPALAREVAIAIPGAAYLDIENSGHCPMLEQPDALVSMIDAFTSGSGRDTPAATLKADG
jgi:3-oxoadipate enol-lactonase